MQLSTAPNPRENSAHFNLTTFIWQLQSHPSIHLSIVHPSIYHQSKPNSLLVMFVFVISCNPCCHQHHADSCFISSSGWTVVPFSNPGLLLLLLCFRGGGQSDSGKASSMFGTRRGPAVVQRSEERPVHLWRTQLEDAAAEWVWQKSSDTDRKTPTLR